MPLNIFMADAAYYYFFRGSPTKAHNHVFFAYFVYSMVLYYERVNTMQNEKIAAPQMVREYKIGNTTYVVKSHSRPDATEDAVSKVKRLIRNDLRKKPQKP